MAQAELHKSLARTLPMRLQRFFSLNPPHLILPNVTSTPKSSPPSQEVDLRPSHGHRNPFMPHKDPATNRWHPPIYSLRRQAELVKLAKTHGVEELLPYTPKKTEERLRRRVEHGLRVKGTGIGEKVKGHAWERTLKGRLQKRREAMLEMPNMIKLWKERGHGRGWKKWPR